MDTAAHDHASHASPHAAAHCASPWRDQLHGVGMRWTRAVHAIWHVLDTAADALDHAQIMAAAERLEGDAVDRVTLYRSLTRLQEAGLVRRVAGDDRRWRFLIARDGAAPRRTKARARSAQAVESFQDCPSCHRITPLDGLLAQAPPGARRWLSDLVQTRSAVNSSRRAAPELPATASTAGKAQGPAADPKLRLVLIAACSDCAAEAA